MAFGFLAVSSPAADSTPPAGAPGAKPGERYPLENYLTRIAEQQWRERAAQLARIKTPADVNARAKFIRTEFVKAIGGLPDQRGPLNARITGTLERKGYRVEKLIFESLPGCHVTANLYIPTTGPGPFPAILGAAGHSMVEGKAAPLYQKGFIALAMRGYIVLAYDPPAQGERYEHRDPKTGEMRSLGHISPGLQCLLTGGTVARYFLWDGMRALDYLLTRPDVDPKRLGAAGNSGGGTQSAFLAVVEPRLGAVAPSCYWTSWEALWNSQGPQDSEQVLPNFIKNGLDFSDLAIAFSPKPVIMLTATRDSFPIAGARAMYAEAKPFFALLGAGKQLGFFEYDDGHGWSQPRREATCAWFDQWFHGKTGPAPEPDIQPETLPALQCTETGQVVTSLSSKTSQALNLEVAEGIWPRRSLAQKLRPAEARKIVAARLAVPVSRAKSTAAVASRKVGPEYVVETVMLTPEPGIELKAEVILPAGPGTRRPAVIVVRDGVAPVDPESDQEVAGWRKAGQVVVVAHLRGLTPILPKAKSYYTVEYRTAMRAILIGKTMTGMRVQDLLAIFDYAAARPEVSPERISIIGRGNMGVVAQYAGALEPRIARVVAAGSVLSYMDIVRTPEYSERLADIIVPGALLDFDLPDLAAVAGDGKLVLVNPNAASGQPVSETAAKAAYGDRTRVMFTTATITPGLVN
ncbi:MAG: acetylxylan esterase [Verrucomicrobia bacterium]|nr:acetylxylan esterase [Verrucomicrobiota bacterium]